MGIFLGSNQRKFVSAHVGKEGQVKNVTSIWTGRNGQAVPIWQAGGKSTYVAVGMGGTIYYSGDGITWKEAASGTTEVFYAVTYGNGQFVCVGQYGTSFYSNNGIDWLPMTGLTAYDHMYGVAYGNNRFVCVGKTGKSYYSLDGRNWVRSTGLHEHVNEMYRDVTYGKSQFVAVSSYGFTHYSMDGITWRAMSGIPSNNSNYGMYSVIYGNGKFVSTGIGGIYYSTGSSWSALTASKNMGNLGYGAGKYIALGAAGWSYYCMKNSLDTWIKCSGIGSYNMSCVTYGNGIYIGVGEAGKTYYSRDGITWLEGHGLDSTKIYQGVAVNIDGGYDSAD